MAIVFPPGLVASVIAFPMVCVAVSDNGSDSGPCYLLGAILSYVVCAIIWAISPLLHFIQSLFMLFGVRPDDDSLAIQVRIF